MRNTQSFISINSNNSLPAERRNQNRNPSSIPSYLPSIIICLGTILIFRSFFTLNPTYRFLYYDYNDNDHLIIEEHEDHHELEAAIAKWKLKQNRLDSNAADADADADAILSATANQTKADWIYEKKDMDYNHTLMKNNINTATISNNPSQNSTTSTTTTTITKPKPLLILHVGIMKTGTTYIQLELLRKKRWNRIYKKLLIDGYEVITQEYAPHTFEKVIQDCFLQESKNDSLWNDLLHLYKDAHTWNQKQNILQSLETFSMIPKPFNSKTKALFQNLHKTYHVQIVIFYRRLHEWLISLYTQYRKPYMYKTRAQNGWRQDYGNLKDDVKLFPTWLEDLVQTNMFHYTVSTEDEYQSLFGVENVHVLDYHANHGLEIEFICHGLPNATNACTEATIMAKEIQDDPKKETRRNTRDMFLLDHDLLVSQAYSEHLITIGRHNATLLLEHKLKEMNVSIQDLPKICLSTKQQRWMDELGRFAEKRYASKPFTEDEFQAYAKKYQSQLCSIDAPKVLQDVKWRSVFSSCAFQKKGCVDEG